MEESTRIYKKHILKQIDKIIDTHGSPGNWDYSSYMHGMYNGMEMTKSIITDEDPGFRDAPDTWIADKAIERKRKALHEKHPALKEAYEAYKIIEALTIQEGRDE